MIIKRLNKTSINVIKDYLPQNVTDSIYDKDIVIYVGLEEDVVIAVMVVRENADVAQIGYISVADEYRQQGICTRMICDYMWGCVDSDKTKLSCILGEEEYDKYVERVLVKLGFMPEHTWDSIITTSVREFCKCELPEVSYKGHMVMDFNELGKEGIRQAAKVIKEKTTFRYTETDLLNCNYELSFVIIVEGVVKDIVLVSDNEEFLELICMYSAKDDIQGTVMLLSELKNRVMNNSKYMDKKVTIPSVNEASQKLATHILKECELDNYYKMSYEFSQSN